MHSQLVSVVVPCYNQAQYLSECIRSVLEQSYLNWECIIVNDGSTDDTEINALDLSKSDPRITYLAKPNGGLSSARNAGIQAAKGEFILPLDADDKIGSQYLEKALTAFAINPDLKLVYCLAEKFGAVDGPWDLQPYSYKDLLRCNMIFCSAVFRKTDWERAGGYDEELKTGWEDWAFWLKMLTPDSKVYQIPSVQFYYRIKEVSMLTAMQYKQQGDVRWLMVERHLSRYKEAYPDPITLTEQNEHLQNLVQRLRNSNSYRFGHLLLKPFSYLKPRLRR